MPTVAQYDNNDIAEANHQDLSNQDVIMAEQREKLEIKNGDTGK